MSIRLRLSLWYAGLSGVMLVAFSVALYLLMAKVLLDEVDSRLRLAASKLHMAVEAANDRDDLKTLADTVLSIPTASQFTAPGLSMQALDKDGRIIAFSSNLKNEQLPVDTLLINGGLQGEQTLTTLTTGGREHVRVLIMPLTVHAKVLGIVQVGQSLHDIEGTVERLGLLLGIGNLGATVAAGLGSWFLTKRGLRPIDEITDTARKIGETRDFRRRIKAKVPSDEVGRLATTFNDMIGQIEGAFQAQKQFVADSSHELRTPLTVIRGNVDLFKRSLSDRDRRECMEAVESEVERMSHIVSDLLLLAQLDAEKDLEKQPVELDSLILEVYRQSRVMLQGRKLVLGHEDSAVVVGDADRLKQVFYNLVDNAVKYSLGGATITFSLHKQEGWARVDVTDTGLGVAPEDLPRLFDRFYRVDKARSRATGGTGLGLTVVKHITESHGGKVTVASSLGRGSTFSIWLPLA